MKKLNTFKVTVLVLLVGLVIGGMTELAYISYGFMTQNFNLPAIFSGGVLIIGVSAVLLFLEQNKKSFQ